MFGVFHKLKGRALGAPTLWEADEDKSLGAPLYRLDAHLPSIGILQTHGLTANLQAGESSACHLQTA